MSSSFIFLKYKSGLLVAIIALPLSIALGIQSIPEGVAIMKLENVSVSITGNSTNPTRFQHPVAVAIEKDIKD